MIIQSCGSSDGASDGASENTEDTSFVDPVNAETLRSALVTGVSSADTDQYWLCSSTALDQALEIYFYDSGSGVEIVAAIPESVSEFTWQTTSATSMTSTYSGGQSSFTNIQFAGRDNISLLLEDSITLSCDLQSKNTESPSVLVGSVEDNTLSYGGIEYSLTHGFEEAFDFRPTSPSDPTVTLDTHSTSEFQLADAVFSQTSVLLISGGTLIIWRPNDAAVWLQADLHSPGGEGFQNATFEYELDSIDESGSEVAGRHFFNEGRFGVDIDGDGNIDSDANEFLDVTDGTMTVKRIGDTQAAMRVDLTLENGVGLFGAFEGAFPVFAP